MTSTDGVFAASDAIAPPKSVAAAISSAYAAALKIDKFLGGRGRIEERYAPDDNPDIELGKVEGFAELERAPERLAPLTERTESFTCAELNMTGEDAEKETARCLQCDLRLRMTPVKFWNNY